MCVCVRACVTLRVRACVDVWVCGCVVECMRERENMESNLVYMCDSMCEGPEDMRSHKVLFPVSS